MERDRAEDESVFPNTETTMTLSLANINSLWGSIVVEELIRSGVDYFCISPGSRSTPLVAAVAANPRAGSFVHFDERGTAFHALGYARATGKPAAIICTSGTATANFFPAIIEASVDCLPMIVLTADRPSELRDTGANQTIDQVNLYGKYVRWFLDLPCPDPSIPATTLLSTIDRLVNEARGANPGPVHLNCMFREPLEPTSTGESLADYCTEIRNWQQSDQPFGSLPPNVESVENRVLNEVASIVKRSSRGLLVLGQLRNDEEKQAALRIIQALDWPVFADIQSGLSVSGHHQLIQHYDLMLTSKKFADRHRPDTIFQLGDRITSKRLLTFVETVKPESHILALNHPNRYDPSRSVTRRITESIASFCDLLLSNLTGSSPSALLSPLQHGSRVVEGLIDETLARTESITECAAAKSVMSRLPSESALFLASSMPIRLADMFADSTGQVLAVASNRGASGIDGTIASAIGYACGLGKGTTVLIGDLALLHDLNSLAMLRHTKQPTTIVVLNNNGGGIFGHLPVAQFPELLSKYFVTPHDLTFEHAASLFRIPYTRVRSVRDLAAVYQEALALKQHSLIEVTIDREQNQQFHNQLMDRISAKLDSL
jgi:2-succinyl-5-enolpyruvyl-6-hydroxy-3-cyclohexene-1-carboxylate synthase